MLFSGNLQCVLGLCSLQFGQNFSFFKDKIGAIFQPNAKCQFCKSTRTDE